MGYKQKNKQTLWWSQLIKGEVITKKSCGKPDQEKEKTKERRYVKGTNHKEKLIKQKT